MTQSPIIYEVNIAIPVTRQAQLLEWLAPHIEKMLTFDGFLTAEVLTPENAQAGEFQCTVQYFVEDHAKLNDYLTHHAEGMRGEGITLFGEDLKTSRRVLDKQDIFSSAPALHHTLHIDQASSDNDEDGCMNCHLPLTGQYCHGCGQRHGRRVISVFDLLSDLIHGLFEWDSRFWRTIVPLMCRPGQITDAYLHGQRKRFMPPVQMYIGASVVFFLIAALPAQDLYDEIDNATLSGDLLTDEDAESLQEGLDELALDLEAQGLGEISEKIQNRAAKISGDNVESNPEKSAEGTAEESDSGFYISVDSDELDGADESDSIEIVSTERQGARINIEDCKQIDDLNITHYEDLIRGRMHSICKKLTTKEGIKSVISTLINNLPKLLFIILPLMAFANKILYIFKRRYYAEHLLFYIHSYSFLFLILALLIVMNIVFERFSWPGMGYIQAVAAIYIVYYFIRAMRVIYKQGRIVTFIKWVTLMVTYLFVSIVGVLFYTLAIAAIV